MFRGSEISRNNSDVSVKSHRNVKKSVKSEPHSDHEDDPCNNINLKRNHSQAFGHEKQVQTSFKTSQETMICKRMKIENRNQVKYNLMKSNQSDSTDRLNWNQITAANPNCKAGKGCQQVSNNYSEELDVNEQVAFLDE